MARELDQIFRPRSVAVIGAGRDPASFGHRVVRYLVEGGYQGLVFPVNPNAEIIHSLSCYHRVDEVPGLVDLAVIAVPAPGVAAEVERCAQKGVRGVVVVSADFSESGPEGRELEQELVEVVRRRGMRMIGPNCMGLINTDPKVRLNATFVPVSMTPGPLAFMSQSGAMGAAILNYAAELGLGFSSYASVGNRADVSANDLLEYWRDDPRTSAVLLYLENFGNPRRFLQIARTITPSKPIIAVKAGRSASIIRPSFQDADKLYGSAAHAEADVAVDALLDQCGVLRVETLEELFGLAQAVISQPLPRGTTVGVLSNGVGPAIMAADALEGQGLEVPPLDPRTGDLLKDVLPSHAGLRNPVDIRTQTDPAYYGAAIGPLLEDPNIEALLIIYVGLDYETVARVILENSKGASKPILVCLMGGRRDDPGTRALQQAGIPVYAFPESACRVLRHLCTYRRYRERPASRVKRFRGVSNEAALRLVQAARDRGREFLSLDEVRAMAKAYKVKVPKEEVAVSEDEAAKAADRIGYPVVVKVPPGRIRKKSDVGGIMLDLRNEREVRRAFREVLAQVNERYPTARVEQLLVQQMFKGGHELIVAASHDPNFGPILKIGAGGPAAEIFRDFQYRIVPITPAEALDMIQSLKIYPLLAGLRGRNPVPIPALVDLLCRASQMLTDFDGVREFEINPLIVFPRSRDFWAVDGRVSLFKQEEKNETDGPKTD